MLTEVGVGVSMDGSGRCSDNVRAYPRTGGGLAPSFIERLWRSPKQEAAYLTEISGGFHAQSVIDELAVRPLSRTGGVRRRNLQCKAATFGPWQANA